jgi:tRNA G18 (ribose-2'-O)-methylase SpoU
MRKLTHQEILKRQEFWACRPRLPMTVVLDNIRSLHNVGSIFRSADGIGVEKLWLCGITGFPPQSQISKTALGAETRVPWEHHRHIEEIIHALRARNYQIVFLEQMDSSVEYQLFTPEPPVCLVMGNEIEGISESVAPLADAAVEIRMGGVKNSLNVSVAFGIVGYHFRNCLLRNL